MLLIWLNFHHLLEGNFRRYFRKMQRLLLNHIAFQAPIAVISRLLKLNRYNYTRDCLKCFRKQTIIGHGASAHLYTKPKSKC